MKDTTSAQPTVTETPFTLEEGKRIVKAIDDGIGSLYRLGAPSPAEQFRAEAVCIANGIVTRANAQLTETRDDLLNRIATLESALAAEQNKHDARTYELRSVIRMLEDEKASFYRRIAAIMATFYHAELSISSTQPIIALALELNPDLVERAR